MRDALEINVALWGMIFARRCKQVNVSRSTGKAFERAAVQPIATNHPTVTTPVRASQAHGHMARLLQKADAGNFGSMVTELRAARGRDFIPKGFIQLGRRT
jgi:hypothetical protein